jgi:hypothetical protein
VDLLAAFLLPALATAIHGYIVIVPGVAEVSTLLYLLVVGVRTPEPA